jgi:hypothetical protein
LLKLAIEILQFISQPITVSFVFSLTAGSVTRIWFFQTFGQFVIWFAMFSSVGSHIL